MRGGKWLSVSIFSPSVSSFISGFRLLKCGGSRILIFTHSGYRMPDPLSWIPDLGSRISDPVSRISDPVSRIPDLRSRIQKQQQKRGMKQKNFSHNFLCSHKFHKIENYFSFEVLKKKIWANFQKIYRTFYPQNCH